MSADCSYGKRKFYKSTGAGVLAASLLVPLGFAAFAAPAPDSGPAYGGSSVDLPLPEGVSPTFVDVEAAAGRTYAVDAAGNRYAWGSDSGNLGLGRSESRSASPRLAENFSVGLEGLSSMGNDSGAAVGDDGKVYTWGDNRHGQLGTGDYVSRNTPVGVDLPGGVAAVSASAGYGFTVAVGDDGNVYGWGLNADGQLGNGGTTNSLTPVAVSAPAGVNFVEVSAGGQSVLALASDGSIYTWGYRNTGSMGTVSPNKPLLTANRVDTPAGVSFVSIFNAQESGYGVTADNTVYHWGRNLTQSTGNISPTVLAAPAGEQFKQVEATNMSLIALSASGKVYTAGWNLYGALGNGSTTDSYGSWVEADLPAGDTFVDVSIGGQGSAFAVNDAGDVYAWGYNGSGELGLGSFWGNQLTPSQVLDPEVKVSTARFAGVAGAENVSTSPSKPGLFTTFTPEYAAGGLVDVSVEWTFGGKRQADVVYEDAFEFTSPLTSLSAPSIGDQPEDVSNDRGTASFSVYAYGTPKASYQWEVSHDGGVSWSALDGAVRSSLYVSDAVDGSQYRVVVSNSEGSVVSDAASYTASSVASSAPQNDGLSFGTVFAVPGGDVVFDASKYVSHPGSSSYSWDLSTDNGASWTAISGATSDSLSVSNVTAGMNNYRYRITITNDAGSASLYGLLNTSNSTATVPVFTANAEDAVVFEGASAYLSVSAGGNPSPSYQWQVSEDDGASWSDIAGETSRELEFDHVGVSKDGNLYRVAASNSAGTAISGFGKLTVNSFGNAPAAAAAEAPVFSADPADASVAEAGDAVFSVSVSGSPTPTVQWQVSEDDGASWSDIAGETGNVLTVSGVAVEDSGKLYRAVASNSAGTVSSAAAALTVVEAGVEVAPTVVSQPSSVSAVEGEDAVFTVVASGSPAPTFQWFERVDGAWVAVDGATSASLTVENVSAGQDGTEYYVEVSNSAGSVSSEVVVLSVSEDDGSEPEVSAPVFTSHPTSDVTVDLFGSVEFEVAVEGSPAPAIQWQFSADGGENWEDLVDENSNVFVLDVALLSMDGFQFRAVASNSEGLAVSNVSVLSVVSDWVTPEISVNPGNASVVAGQDAVFTVEAEGNPELEYQWQVSVNGGDDWTNVEGAVEATLTVSGVSVEHNGNLYRVIVSNDAGEVISAPATLSVSADADNGNGGGNVNPPAGGGDAKPTNNTSSDVAGVMLATAGGMLLLGGAVTAAAVSRRKQA